MSRRVQGGHKLWAKLQWLPDLSLDERLYKHGTLQQLDKETAAELFEGHVYSAVFRLRAFLPRDDRLATQQIHGQAPCKKRLTELKKADLRSSLLQFLPMWDLSKGHLKEAFGIGAGS